jgi:hypothetical protein
MPIARVCSLRPAVVAAVGMDAGAAGVRRAAVDMAAEVEDAGGAVWVGVAVAVAVAAVAVFGLDLSGSARSSVSRYNLNASANSCLGFLENRHTAP